jgi:hypothetical protein
LPIRSKAWIDYWNCPRRASGNKNERIVTQRYFVGNILPRGILPEGMTTVEIIFCIQARTVQEEIPVTKKMSEKA